MLLTYRAVRYEVNPTDVKTTANYYVGVYRGVKNYIPAPVVTHPVRHPRILKYRGSTYSI